MAIPSRQIGWGTESNLLWQISKQLEYLTKVTSQSGVDVDKEFVVTTYTVKTAFTGASVGDIITATQVIDVSSAIPVTITTLWRNQTTATDLASAPSFSNLSLEGTTGLTDAQLRASAVLISGTVTANTGLLQPLTNSELRATPIVVSLPSTTITNFPATQPISAAALPLPLNAATSALQTTGNTSLGSIDTKTPALDNNRVPVIPSMASGGNISITTASTGTNFTAFASQVCKQLTLSNQSGTVVEVRQGATGVALQIPTGAFYTFFGITNTNQLDVRRTDVSNTQITLTARWEA